MRFIRLHLSFLAVLTLVFSLFPTQNLGAAVKKPETVNMREMQQSCSGCHVDLLAVLPKSHPKVSGKVLSVCMECHAPNTWGMAEPNTFDAKIHLVHLKKTAQTDCLVCHTWKPGKDFGIAGTALSLGKFTEEDMATLKEKFSSAADSEFLDAFHASKGILCMNCHGKDILGENPVENKTCLGCHGPVETLIAKTAPKDFPDRNPHNSHLGEIGCTICHSGHAAAKVYCLECHPKFNIKFKTGLNR